MGSAPGVRVVGRRLRAPKRRAAMLAGALLVLGACNGSGDGAGADGGADGGDGQGNDVATPDSPASTTVASDGESTSSETSVADRPTFVDGPLVEVCPQRLVIQLAGQASVEHGPLFRLLADDVDVDVDREVVSAPIVRPDGTPEDVTLEIRFGGPAVDFRPALDVMVDSDEITFAETSVVGVVAASEALATTAVVALTDRSHQMVMWDPGTYPSVATFADLAEAGVEVRHVTSERFIDFLVARGELDADQLVDGFFGEPAAFVESGGTIAQQGDVLVEPFLYPSLPQWGRPIAMALAADAGWASYDDVLAVRASDLDSLATCLGRFVPIVQDSIVAHYEESAPTNARLAAWRTTFNPLTRTAPELFDLGAAAAIESGIVANGPDGSVGGFDLARVASFLADVSAALGLESDTPSTVVTNDFAALDRSL